MTNPSQLIIEHTLKSSFHLMLTVVNQYGEEHEFIYKKSKKKFLAEMNLDKLTVKLVDDFPPREMELDVFYVKRSGKTVWVKEMEANFA